MRLSDYRCKRRSDRRGRRPTADKRPGFVIHAPGGDHYQLRLEIDGVLVSWAIPNARRMARRSEDQPLEYSACNALVWDHGTYANVTNYEMAEGLERGHLSFRLRGEKLRGGYTLTRIREGEDETWLLIRRKDEDADARRKPLQNQPEEGPPDRTLDELDELDELS
jgi:DNA ligase D-like protein (predicted 3'-phosphoesterase)